MSEIQQRTMTRDEAERLTERIRLTATSFMETRDKLAALIREAQEGRAHEALGFASWTAYVAAVCSDTPLMRLSRDERRVIVADLAEQGMSTRAIAPVVGVSQRTVNRDMRTSAPESFDSPDAAGVPNETPAPHALAAHTFEPSPWDPAIDRDTGEIKTAAVTGLDGKTYQRPEPKERTPKRRPLAETTRRALLALNDATEKLAIEINDDRFPQNKDELAPLYRNQLTYVIETCQGYLDDILTKENTK